MGNILDVYKTLTSRIDTSVASGTLSYFTYHYKGVPLDEQINNENNCPFIFTYLGDNELVQNNIRENSLEMEVITTIKTRQPTKDNMYNKDSDDTGILADIEKVIDAVMIDERLNDTADVIPSYRIEIEKVGSNFVMANIIWTIRTRPYRYGTLSA